MTNKSASERLIVEGSVPLKGEVVVSGAKNASIKMIAAALLTSEEVSLSNIPEIDDIFVMVEAAERMGVKISWVGEHHLTLRADDVTSLSVNEDLTSKARSIVMFMGPLLARFGRFQVGGSEGCLIGKNRPINRHVEAFRKMGASVSCQDGVYVGRCESGLHGVEIFFEKNTVMGTENVILAAVLARGETKIYNAAEEPEVDDLISLLSKMGAKIERVDPRTLRIEGASSLHGAAHEILPDRNEVVTFAVAAAITSGDLTIKKIRQSDVTAFLAKLEKVGVNFESSGDSLRVWREKGSALKPINIETSPHPGFMTDWQQAFCLLLTSADGVSLVHDTIYINRFEFAKELNRMGAKIDVVRPSEAGITPVVSDDDYDVLKEGEPYTVARITGPTPLSGRRLTVPDLRAGATLVLAALAAQGRSEILGVNHIDRGYERFDEKLSHLGARIRRL